MTKKWGGKLGTEERRENPSGRKRKPQVAQKDWTPPKRAFVASKRPVTEETVFVEGVEYPSLAKAAWNYKIDLKTVKRRLAAGWTLKRALKEPVSGSSQFIA